jgi:hypothetical protein
MNDDIGHQEYGDHYPQQAMNQVGPLLNYRKIGPKQTEITAYYQYNGHRCQWFRQISLR